MKPSGSLNDPPPQSTVANQATLFDALRVGLWEWFKVDEDRAYWSPYCHHMLGYVVGEMAPGARTFTKLVHPDDVDSFTGIADMFLSDEDCYSAECRLQLKSGQYRWFEICAAVMCNELGEVQCVRGTLRDVHARKQAELTLRNAEAELQRSNRALVAFVRSASHDLQTPLRSFASVLGWIEDDLQDGNVEAIPEHTATLRARVARLQGLLADLLTYSRTNQDEAPCEIDLTKLLATLAEDVTRSYPGFSVRYSASLPTVLAAPTQLRQVLANLLENAAKHHDRAMGHVCVEVSTTATHIHLAVEDDGPGIPAAYHERIFKPFETIESRKNGGGSGLGLALVQEVISKWRGQISIVPQEGRGARFELSWPIPHLGNDGESR